MPNRTSTDEREKFDHSGHPTTHPLSSDLRTPTGGTERPSEAEPSRGGISQREPVTPADSRGSKLR